MSRLIVEICEISEIHVHPNADRLELAMIKGWQCVVQKGAYSRGDKVIYCPIDSILPVELSDAMGVTQYLSKGRVKTVKLRGQYSQGLIIPLMFLPAGEDEIGYDVQDILNITKYEPPVKLMTSGKRVPDNPMFPKYTNIDNIKHFPDVIKIGEEVVITEKIHGCLEYDSLVTLVDGSKKRIGEIVNKDLIGLYVLGYDEVNKVVVPSKITKVYNNGKFDKWVRIKIENKGMDKGNNYTSIRCTFNHKIYINGKYVEAAKIKEGDEVLSVRNVSELTPIQEQVVLSVETYTPRYNIRYDIETETHNFFTSNVLVHNSNFRAGIVDGQLMVGYHNVILEDRWEELGTNDRNLYWMVARQFNLAERLNEGDIIYGEVYGKGIQGGFWYDLDGIDMRVFDVMQSLRYLSDEEMEEYCNNKCLTTTPVIYRGPWDKSLLPMVSGTSLIASHIREGFVVKPVLERWDGKVGRVILKHISEDYLVGKNVKAQDDTLEFDENH